MSAITEPDEPGAVEARRFIVRPDAPARVVFLNLLQIRLLVASRSL